MDGEINVFYYCRDEVLLQYDSAIASKFKEGPNQTVPTVPLPEDKTLANMISNATYEKP